MPKALFNKEGSNELKEQLLAYQKWSPLFDPKIYAEFIELAKQGSQSCQRSFFPAHFTSSALVISRAKKSLLLIHHKKLAKWLQPGGHLEEGTSPYLNALREVLEETGVTLHLDQIWPSSQKIAPWQLDIHTIPANKKEPAHQHFDLRYLFEIDAEKTLTIEKKEVNQALWLPLSQISTTIKENALLAAISKAQEVLS